MASKKRTSTSKKSTKSTPVTASAPTVQPANMPDAMQALLSALGGIRAPSAQQMMVGIRNIGGCTVGIPKFGNEPSFSLHPYSPTDPNSIAIVAWPRWQQLRKSSLFGEGLIERYDQILDASLPKGPADQPQECHPDHDKNRVENGHTFITSKSEGSLREAILAMTSASSLHRILATVDEKIRELQQAFREEGEQNPSKRAVDECPGAYQLAEKFAELRLHQISPQRVEDLKPARTQPFT